MAIDLTSTGKQAADLLNALDAGANTYDDSDWNPQNKIEETALDVDGMITKSYYRPREARGPSTDES